MLREFSLAWYVYLSYTWDKRTGRLRVAVYRNLITFSLVEVVARLHTEPQRTVKSKVIPLQA
jgi:hypothetical protein